MVSSSSSSIHDVCVLAPALRSMAGKLSIIKDKSLRARFENAKTAEEVAALADEFVAAIKSNKCEPAFFAELEPSQRQQHLQSLIRRLCEYHVGIHDVQTGNAFLHAHCIRMANLFGTCCAAYLGRRTCSLPLMHAQAFYFSTSSLAEQVCLTG